MQRVVKAALASTLLLLVAPCTRAASVTVVHIGLEEGNTTALLEATSQYYVDAMRALISERYKDEYLAIRWEMLESAMTEAPVARLEYRFVVDGETRIRVYHAMGGRPLGAVAQSVFQGATPAVTPGSPDDSLDEEWWETSPSAEAAEVDLVAMDAEDAALYKGFSTTNIRARILPRETSVLQSFRVDGVDRALDPEFKALRAIEHDLQAGAMPSGGSIRGIVGGATCGSCRYSMKTLADTYDVDIHVTQMFGSLPTAEKEALIASGTARLRGQQLVSSEGGRPLLARDVLASSREQQVKRALTPASLNRSFKGIPWRPRSFRLGPMRMPRVSENAADRPLPNADAAELPPPSC